MFVCVCMSVLYRNPNSWTDWEDVIWQGDGPRGQKGSGGLTRYPPRIWGAKRGSGLSLEPQPCILANKPWFSGSKIQIQKDFGPMSFWSHGQSPWRGVHKIQIVVYVLIVLAGVGHPLPWHRGLPGFWSLNHAFWRTLYQTKVVGHLQYSGGRSPFQTPNPDLEGPGPGVRLEPWWLIPKESL